MTHRHRDQLTFSYEVVDASGAIQSGLSRGRVRGRRRRAAAAHGLHAARGDREVDDRAATRRSSCCRSGSG